MLQQVARPELLAAVVGPYHGVVMPPQLIWPRHKRLTGNSALTYPTFISIGVTPTWLTEEVVDGAAETITIMPHPYVCSVAVARVPVELPMIDIKARRRHSVGTPFGWNRIWPGDQLTPYGYSIKSGDPRVIAGLVEAGLDRVLTYRFRFRRPDWRMPLERITFTPLNANCTEIRIQSLVVVGTRLNELTVLPLVEAMSAVLATTQRAAQHTWTLR